MQLYVLSNIEYFFFFVSLRQIVLLLLCYFDVNYFHFAREEEGRVTLVYEHSAPAQAIRNPTSEMLVSAEEKGY